MRSPFEKLIRLFDFRTLKTCLFKIMRWFCWRDILPVINHHLGTAKGHRSKRKDIGICIYVSVYKYNLFIWSEGNGWLKSLPSLCSNTPVLFLLEYLESVTIAPVSACWIRAPSDQGTVLVSNLMQLWLFSLVEDFLTQELGLSNPVVSLWRETLKGLSSSLCLAI